jgi:hypothetical protein
VAGAVLTADATFTNVYQAIICPNCRPCHAETIEAGLLLIPKATAYQKMVGGDPGPATVSGACADSGTKLVAPNDVNRSLFYLKLARMAPCGDEAMPPGADSAGVITTDMLARVRAWIEAGARND